ncbi:MAG: beta/gamma crystallin domain-containing protein [Nitrospira sp.]
MMRLALLLAGSVGVGVMSAYAAADIEMKPVDKACWAEIFEDTDFDVADPHVKIQGPAQIANLKDYSGTNWNNEIESIIVGPNTHIKAYSDKDFKGTELDLTPNKRVNDLSKLNMSDEIESMKITCGG